MNFLGYPGLFTNERSEICECGELAWAAGQVNPDKENI